MFVRLVKIFGLIALMFQVSGCGGESDTNGTIVISAPTAVSAGKSFQATASVTSVAGAAVTIPVSFLSSDPTIIPSATVDTNSGGIATAQMVAANIINADKDVIITAKAGGLTSSTKVTVRANKLTFNPPPKTSLPGGAGTVEFFITGAGSLVKYTDADNIPLGGKVVSLQVNTITPGVTDVRWHNNLVDTSYFAANPKSFTTLSDGSLPNAVVSVVANSPPAGTSADFNVNFIVSVTDPLFGVMTIPGDIVFTLATP